MIQKVHLNHTVFFMYIGEYSNFAKHTAPCINRLKKFLGKTLAVKFIQLY